MCIQMPEEKNESLGHLLCELQADDRRLVRCQRPNELCECEQQHQMIHRATMNAAAQHSTNGVQSMSYGIRPGAEDSDARGGARSAAAARPADRSPPLSSKSPAIRCTYHCTVLSTVLLSSGQNV